MLNRNLLASLALIFAAGGLWAGCTVGFSAEEENLFSCDTDEDCLEDYACGQNGYCKLKVSDQVAPPCDDSENGIDQDGDGYGTGDDRSNCSPLTERDCNDSDATVYPGAPELCDGQVNDCSVLRQNMDATEATAFSCTGDDDSTCPDLADVPEGVVSISSYRRTACESGQCVYKSLRSADCSVDSTPVDLTCVQGTTGYSWVRDSSKTYNDLPQECTTE